MKKKQLLAFIGLFAVFTITNANQFKRFVSTDKLDSSYLDSYFPTDYNNDNIFSNPRIDENSYMHYNNFESVKVPITELRKENIGSFVNNHPKPNDAPAFLWQLPSTNGPEEEMYKLHQTQILQDLKLFQNRGFPISSIYYDLVKGIARKVSTEVPIDADDIKFSPSASKLPTVLQMKSHSTLPSHNRDDTTHFYKTVDKINDQPVSEITTQKINGIKNIPEQVATKLQHVTTSTLPPIPTLSAWLDGFGK